MDEDAKRIILDAFDRLKPFDRIEMIEGLYLADLSGSVVMDPGSKALRLKDLALDDYFICVPFPEDEHGNGGLKSGHFIYKKIKTSRRLNGMDLDELSNVLRIKDNKIFTVHPASWVLRISM